VATRIDLLPPVRAVAGCVFIAEGILCLESVAAQRAGRNPRALTITRYCWQHPRLVPVVLAGLAAHLLLKPPTEKRKPR
jgi:hypothetical protein